MLTELQPVLSLTQLRHDQNRKHIRRAQVVSIFISVAEIANNKKNTANLTLAELSIPYSRRHRLIVTDICRWQWSVTGTEDNFQ